MLARVKAKVATFIVRKRKTVTIRMCKAKDRAKVSGLASQPPACEIFGFENR